MKEVFSFLILIFVLLSCKKGEGKPEPAFYKLDAEGLAYIQLPDNSYYIYQDSATAIEDSVFVETSTLVNFTVPPVPGCIFGNCPGYSYQVYTLKLKAANSLPNEYWFSGSASGYQGGICDLYTNIDSLQFPVFTYPINGRSINSMEVEGNTFTNVEKYEFENISSNPAENIRSVYYWAKDIGIIKRQITIDGLTKTESLKRHG